ncbi:MAG: hypothetical protein CL677_08615, partial [Bdellovibrionaceae bacterium]|nr:hypothetical protein [Pseudobdellovibrionaceae bacterium]
MEVLITRMIQFISAHLRIVGQLSVTTLSMVVLTACNSKLDGQFNLPQNAEEDSLPTLSFTSPDSDTSVNSSSTITYNLEYSNTESVDLNNSHISATYTGTADCDDPIISNANTSTPTFTVSNCTGDGTLVFNISPGSSLSESNETDSGATSSTVEIDNTAPTLSIGSITPSSGSYATTFNFPITISGADNVLLTSGDISVNDSGGGPCDTTAVSGVTSNSATVELSGCAGTGSLTISIASGVATDDAGNSSTAPADSGAISIANAGPLVSVSGVTPSTGSDSTSFVFSVAITGSSTVNLTAGDITVNNSGGGPCDTPVISNGTTATPSVTLTNCTGDGDVSITVGAGIAEDASSNPSAASAASSAITVDNTAPTVSVGTASPTSGNSSTSFVF